MLRREKQALKQKEIDQTLIASRRALIEAERQEALAVKEDEKARVHQSMLDTEKNAQLKEEKARREDAQKKALIASRQALIEAQRVEKQAVAAAEEERVLQSLRDTQAAIDLKDQAVLRERQVQKDKISETQELLKSRKAAGDAAAAAEHERVLQSLRDTEAEMKRKEDAAKAQRQVEMDRIAGTRELLASERKAKEAAVEAEHERVLQSLRDTEAEMKRKEEAAMAQRQVETERIAGTKELLASERKAKEAAAEAEKSRLENQRLISENVQKRKEEEAARQRALAQVMRDERAELDEQRR